MAKRRELKAPILIKKLAAEFVSRNISLPGAVITASRVEIKAGFKEVKIFLSVWPEEKEKEAMYSIAEAENGFYEYMMKNFKIKYMPRFSFEIDKGERARRKIEEILQKNIPR